MRPPIRLPPPLVSRTATVSARAVARRTGGNGCYTRLFAGCAAWLSLPWNPVDPTAPFVLAWVLPKQPANHPHPRPLLTGAGAQPAMAAGWCLPQSIAYTIEGSISRRGCCKPWRPRGSGTVASATGSDGKWAGAASAATGRSGVGTAGRNRTGAAETREGAVIIGRGSDHSYLLGRQYAAVN